LYIASIGSRLCFWGNLVSWPPCFVPQLREVQLSPFTVLLSIMLSPTCHNT